MRLKNIAEKFAQEYHGKITGQVEGNIGKGQISFRVTVDDKHFYILYADEWFYSARKICNMPDEESTWLSMQTAVMDRAVQDRAVLVTYIQNYEYWLYAKTWQDWSLEHNTKKQNKKFGNFSYLIPCRITEPPPKMSNKSIEEYFKFIGQTTL